MSRKPKETACMGPSNPSEEEIQKALDEVLDVLKNKYNIYGRDRLAVSVIEHKSFSRQRIKNIKKLRKIISDMLFLRNMEMF